MNDRGIMVVLSGFSGSGKGTIVKRLLSDHPEEYALSISATTRKPRRGEKEGREYFFRTKEEFAKLIEDDGLLEYACYVGNYYGTPRKYVLEKLDEGRNVILEIEIQGALKIKEQFPDALLVFVTPPSAQELLARLAGRGTESPGVIRDRMSRAAREAEGCEAYDHLIINDEIEHAADQLHMVIQCERSRMKYGLGLVSDIKKDLEEYLKGENQ